MLIPVYPRTSHIEGSRLGFGDPIRGFPFKELEGKHLVIEEKIDGAHTGVLFVDGELRLVSRGCTWIVEPPFDTRRGILTLAEPDVNESREVYTAGMFSVSE